MFDGNGIHIEDIQELERFRDYLKQEKYSFEDELKSITGSFESLNDHWKDRKYDKFKDVFDQFVRNKLSAFIEDLNENINHLSKKIDIVNEYLERQ